MEKLGVTLKFYRKFWFNISQDLWRFDHSDLTSQPPKELTSILYSILSTIQYNMSNNIIQDRYCHTKVIRAPVTLRRVQCGRLLPCGFVPFFHPPDPAIIQHLLNLIFFHFIVTPCIDQCSCNCYYTTICQVNMVDDNLISFKFKVHGWTTKSSKWSWNDYV